jgi:hypothetical protein
MNGARQWYLYTPGYGCIWHHKVGPYRTMLAAMDAASRIRGHEKTDAPNGREQTDPVALLEACYWGWAGGDDVAGPMAAARDYLASIGRSDPRYGAAAEPEAVSDWIDRLGARGTRVESTAPS